MLACRASQLGVWGRDACGGEIEEMEQTLRGRGGGHLSVGQMLKYFQPVAAQASQRLADTVLGASLKCKFVGPTQVLVRIGGVGRQSVLLTSLLMTFYKVRHRT